MEGTTIKKSLLRTRKRGRFLAAASSGRVLDKASDKYLG